jgi:hypothetical protein
VVGADKPQSAVAPGSRKLVFIVWGSPSLSVENPGSSALLPK